MMTLAVLLLFSSLVTEVSLSIMHQKQQVLYYQQAKEISELHTLVVATIRNGLSKSTLSYKSYELAFNSISDEEWEVVVGGRVQFIINISLNIENQSIKAYNITGL